MKKLLLLLLVPVAAFVIWALQRKSEPPSIPFTKVRRETLVSTLATNGKVEPFEWQTVRAEAPGIIEKVAVEEGRQVARGAVLAVMIDPVLKSATDAAEAKLSEVKALLTSIEAGGRPSELTDIENNLARARFEHDDATRNYQSLRRLAEKQAATAVEVATAFAQVKQAQLEIEALDKRRASLVSKSDRSVAEARVRDAEAAVKLAHEKQLQAVLRAPIAGTVYQLVARPGAYLAAGDAAANVGRMDKVRVRVYVDEPELGRVAEGQPVEITWDALPGKRWKGEVEKKPSAIQTLGTRQVGEVICTIENPGGELIPGTNVNAAIRTAVAEHALVVPKEVMRRDSQGTFVLVLRGAAVARQAVETGVSSITKFQVVAGLAEGDSVAMPTDLALKPGARVTPVYP